MSSALFDPFTQLTAGLHLAKPLNSANNHPATTKNADGSSSNSSSNAVLRQSKVQVRKAHHTSSSLAGGCATGAEKVANSANLGASSVANHQDLKPLRKQFSSASAVKDFAEFGLPLETLESLRVVIPPTAPFVPTAVQQQAAPAMLAGHDVLVCAPTGSGKTLAYVIPMILRIKQKASTGDDVAATIEKQSNSAANKGIKKHVLAPTAVIVAPTHELAVQIAAVASVISPKGSQVVCLTSTSPSLKQQNGDVDILVATPQRLLRDLNLKFVAFRNTSLFVFDEVDKMLELGLREQADGILGHLKSKTTSAAQVAMFSATIISSVEALAISALNSEALRITVGQKNSPAASVEQKLVFTSTERGKIVTLEQQLHRGELAAPILLFVQSVHRAQDLYRELVPRLPAGCCGVIHAKKSKEERESVLYDFKMGKVWMLIATDVMSRGIDAVVQTVVNFDFPSCPETYIHRIGRTGRAGRQGKALTYFTREDGPRLRILANIMQDSGCDVPEWMLALKAPSQKERKLLRTKPPRRKSITQAVKKSKKAENKKKLKKEITTFKKEV